MPPRKSQEKPQEETLGAVINRLKDIEDKIDSLLAQNNYWAVCTSCEGKGYTVEYKGDPGQEIRNTCNRCAGTGSLKSGKILQDVV